MNNAQTYTAFHFELNGKAVVSYLMCFHKSISLIYSFTSICFIKVGINNPFPIG